MMRYLLSICALFLLTATFLAQIPKKVENWQVFSPVSDEFSVDTPLTLDKFGDDQRRSLRRFSGSINGVFLYVFSEPSKKPDKWRQGFLEMVGEILPQIGQTADIIPFNSSGSGAVSFKDKFGYWHHLATLRTDTRNYIAQTISLDENDSVATRFIKSFGLSERPMFAPQEESVVSGTNPFSPPAPRNSDTVLRNGLGSGTGSGVSNSSVPASVPGSTSALKIISKPRPSYTDIARKYGVQGTVLLEVEFLSSGEIGNVKALTQLPLGLTQSAAAAGKSIAFQPAYENGVPVNVTKKIEYSYAIY